MSKWFRQVHRWLSIAFVVTIVITSVALARPHPVLWVSYVPLLPLAPRAPLLELPFPLLALIPPLLRFGMSILG